MNKCILFLILVIPCGVQAERLSKTWTDTAGNEIRGVFKQCDGNRVTILQQPGDKVVVVPVTQLSSSSLIQVIEEMAKPEEKDDDAVKSPAALDERVTYTLPQIMAYIAKLKSSGKETSVSISAAISRAKLVVDLPVTDVLSNIALVRHHARFAAYQCDRVPIKDNDLLASLRKGDTLRLTGTLLCKPHDHAKVEADNAYFITMHGYRTTEAKPPVMLYLINYSVVKM